MIEVTATEYEVKAYEFKAGYRTFRIARRKVAGDFCVTSYQTDNPTNKGYWGCRCFATLADVERNYKSLRGISKLLEGEL